MTETPTDQEVRGNTSRDSSSTGDVAREGGILYLTTSLGVYRCVGVLYI